MERSKSSRGVAPSATTTRAAFDQRSERQCIVGAEHAAANRTSKSAPDIVRAVPRANRGRAARRASRRNCHRRARRQKDQPVEALRMDTGSPRRAPHRAACRPCRHQDSTRTSTQWSECLRSKSTSSTVWRWSFARLTARLIAVVVLPSLLLGTQDRQRAPAVLVHPLQHLGAQHAECRGGRTGAVSCGAAGP